MSAFTGCGKSLLPMAVSIVALSENIFLIMHGPSYEGVHLPLGSIVWYAWCLKLLINHWLSTVWLTGFELLTVSAFSGSYLRNVMGEWYWHHMILLAQTSNSMAFAETCDQHNMPHVIQMQACPLAIQRFWEILWILTWLPLMNWTIPCHAPWLEDRDIMPLSRAQEMSLLLIASLKQLLSIGRTFVHWMFIMWTSLMSNTLLYANNDIQNAKLMSVLKFLKNVFLVKQDL